MITVIIDWTFTYNLYYNRDTFKIDYYYGSTKLNTIKEYQV